MKFYVEILVVVILFILLLIWAIWFRFTGWINKRRYKPENDKGRAGEENRRLGGRDSATSKPSNSLPGPSSVEPRELLQTTSSDKLGEDGIEPGKTGNSNRKAVRRNPLRRRKRK